MKIIGPIAGIGSRLRPFTLSKPKAFIRVAGKTVLDHILYKFNNAFNVDTELILIVGYKKKQIIEYVKKRYNDKFRLSFIEQKPRGYEDNIPYYWGLGEAVYLAHERFETKQYPNKLEEKREGALIFLGDMIILDDYSYILSQFYESDVDGIITVMEVPKKDASSYGIVEVDENNLIKRLIEKPKKYISNLAIAGIYAFSNSAIQVLFSHIKKYLDQRTPDTGEIYLTESLQDLINDGFKMSAVRLKKKILDFGRPSEWLNGNKHLLEQNFTKKEDFQKNSITFEKSYIKNPVYIGENTKILNSIIGPYCSIGENSLIEECILSNCVIEKNVYLKRIITENSIIGSDVSIENVSKENLIIGDKSIY